MRSKTSFFNKALFLSDIKRYWWICAAQLIMLILTCAVPLYSKCLDAQIRGLTDIASWLHTAPYVTIPFGFGTAIILFSFMHFNASVSCMHSLPAKRSTIFATKLVSGAVIGVVPVVVTALILLVMSRGKTCGGYILPGDILEWTYAAFIYGLVVFSLTTVVNMMTGNPVGTVIFTIGFTVIVPIFVALFTSIFETEVHGFNSRYVGTILDYIYVQPYDITRAEYVAIYPVMSVVFLVDAYALYRVRKSERHGEVIAFPALAPVFIAVIAIIASGIGHSYCTNVLNIKSLFTILPFGMLGTAIAYMIWKKSLAFKKCPKPIGIYLILALLFIAVIKFDLVGFERYVPSPDDVEGVTVSTNLADEEPIFTKKEHIEAVTKLHAHLADQKGRLILRGAHNEIVYKLKNGRTVRRNYVVDYKIDKTFLKPVYETSEFRKDQFELLRHDDADFTAIEIYDRRLKDENGTTLYPDNDMFDKLLTSVKKDLENTSYDELTTWRYSSTTVSMSWMHQTQYRDEKYKRSEQFYITPGAVNTQKILAELGLYEKLPTADDIAHINMTARKNAKGELVSTKKYEDRESIDAIYAIYDEMLSEQQTFLDYESAVDVCLEYTLKNGHTFSVSRTYDTELIPQILR